MGTAWLSGSGAGARTGAKSAKDGGAQFAQSQMPSSGKLTVESDRQVIKEIEDKVMQTYVHFAVLAQCTLVNLLDQHSGDNNAGKLNFTLHGKQFSGSDVLTLREQLSALPHVEERIASLDLSRNLLDADGCATLFKDVALRLPVLTELDLSENPLMGPAAMRTICLYLGSSVIDVLHLRACGMSNDAIKHLQRFKFPKGFRRLDLSVGGSEGKGAHRPALATRTCSQRPPAPPPVPPPAPTLPNACHPTNTQRSAI